MTATQPYIPVSRRPLDLEDYINVARRHSGWIAGPTFAGIVISVVVALAWPNTWEAKAVMQITPSRISENLVPSVVTQRLTERIQQMQSNITSRQSLANIINDPRLNLYREEIKKEPMEDVEDEMRRDIHIGISPENISAKGASVFSISFRYRTRRGATETVNTLITRFIQESNSSQHDQQATISDYFGDALAQAKAGLEKQDELLTKFRKEHEGRLPEQEQMNEANLHSLEAQVTGMDQELNRLNNDHLTLQTQITYLDNEVKLNESFAQDATDLPPAANSAMARKNDELLATSRAIDQDELKLQELKKTFRSDYPEIRQFETHLKTMQDQRDKLIADQQKQIAEEAAKPKPAVKKVTNIAAIESRNKAQGEVERYRTLLQINENNTDHLRQDREKRLKEIENYRSRLSETSLLMAPEQDLLRDYKNAAEKYEKYQQGKDLTAQSQELISRRATEVLEPLDMPTIPQKPVSPQRPLIIGAGFGISLMLGLALAGVQEARDSSLKNLKDVRAYTNLPVLCSIPLLENTLLVKRKRRITYLAWSAAVIVGILAVSAASFYYLSAIANQ